MLRATPWAEGAKGPRDRHLRLVVEMITGRRLTIDDEPATRDPHPR
jgi:hypothetical protein